MGSGLAPAWATSSSSAAFSNITIQLVDLDTSDGITPYLTFSEVLDSYGTMNGHLLTVGASAGEYLPGAVWNQDSQRSLRLNQPASVSTSTATSSAAASISGDGSQITLLGAGRYATALTGLSASGAAAGPPGSGNSSYRTLAQAFPMSSNNFQLSANTLLLVKVTSSLDVSTTVTGDALTAQQEWAYARTWLELAGKGPTGVRYQSSSDSDEYGARFASMVPGSYSNSRTMIASFTNGTGLVMDGRLNLLAEVSGASILAAAPVPEPASLALLLAGLAVVGTASRRQRSPSA
jgi:hypothetical protein